MPASEATSRGLSFIRRATRGHERVLNRDGMILFVFYKLYPWLQIRELLHRDKSAAKDALEAAAATHGC